MVFMLIFNVLRRFACLEIGCVESLTLFISELSFWRCELLKNDGRSYNRNEIKCQIPSTEKFFFFGKIDSEIKKTRNLIHFLQDFSTTGNTKKRNRTTSICDL